MANAKAKELVELTTGSVSKKFELSHAERILRMPKNGGWQLPEKSTYEFIDNGIKRKADKGGGANPGQKA